MEYAIEVVQANLKIIRKVLGWTQQNLADRIGVSKAMISHIETGKYKLTKTQLLALMYILETQFDSYAPETQERLNLLLTKKCKIVTNIRAI